MRAVIRPMPGHRWLVLFALGTGALLFGLVSRREFLSYGEETDFLATYLPQMMQFLETGRLEISFQPPLYLLTVAGIQSLTGDAVGAGLLLSAVSGVVVTVTTWFLYREVGGTWAAWGAVMALVTSRTFLTYGSSASTDVFFLAVFQLALLAVFRAAVAAHPRAWFGAGIVAGLTVLARTNGISIAMAAIVLAVLGPTRVSRRRAVAIYAGGLVLPLLGWAAYASIQGVPMLPHGHAGNLAMTYFSGPHVVDPNVAVAFPLEPSSSIIDVFCQDPLQVLTVYGRNLLVGIREDLLVGELSYKPAGLLAVAGLLLVGRWPSRHPMALLAVILLGQLLLVNLFLYLPRLHLVLLPYYGALAGPVGAWLWRRLNRRWWRWILSATLGVLLILGSVRATRTANQRNHRDAAELGAIVARAGELVRPGGNMLARKPHVPFYLGCAQLLMPPSESLVDFRRWLQEQTVDVAYVFYGPVERALRPALHDLTSPERSPAWLRPVVTSDPPGDWVIYEVRSGH